MSEQCSTPATARAPRTESHPPATVVPIGLRPWGTRRDRSLRGRSRRIREKARDVPRYSGTRPHLHHFAWSNAWPTAITLGQPAQTSTPRCRVLGTRLSLGGRYCWHDDRIHDVIPMINERRCSGIRRNTVVLRNAAFRRSDKKRKFFQLW